MVFPGLVTNRVDRGRLDHAETAANPAESLEEDQCSHQTDRVAGEPADLARLARRLAYLVSGQPIADLFYFSRTNCSDEK